MLAKQKISKWLTCFTHVSLWRRQCNEWARSSQWDRGSHRCSLSSLLFPRNFDLIVFLFVWGNISLILFPKQQCFGSNTVNVKVSLLCYLIKGHQADMTSTSCFLVPFTSLSFFFWGFSLCIPFIWFFTFCCFRCILKKTWKEFVFLIASYFCVLQAFRWPLIPVWLKVSCFHFDPHVEKYWNIYVLCFDQISMFECIIFTFSIFI